jgi:F0F1-type ATP synthase membrane subunit b/b'
MIGAGTFINPLLKVITTVAILAAASFFLVKPALDTTESISNDVNDSISQSFNGFDDLDSDVQPQIQHAVRKAEKLQENAQQASAEQIANANKLLNCISDASGDVNAIQRCNTKFTP